MVTSFTKITVSAETKDLAQGNKRCANGCIENNLRENKYPRYSGRLSYISRQAPNTFNSCDRTVINMESKDTSLWDDKNDVFQVKECFDCKTGETTNESEPTIEMPDDEVISDQSENAVEVYDMEADAHDEPQVDFPPSSPEIRPTTES